MRYFQNDDQVGLKEMVRREKMSSSQDQNALYSRMAAKVKHQVGLDVMLQICSQNITMTTFATTQQK